MKNLQLFIIQSLIWSAALIWSTGISFAQQADFPVDKKSLMDSRWPESKARAYMEPFGVIKGCNFVPSYCKSPMQHFIDFREDIIRRELGYARNAGLNSIRLWIPCFAWQNDREAFYRTLDKYLALCDENGLTVMATLTCYSVTTDTFKTKLEVRPQRFYPGIHIQPLEIEGLHGRNNNDWPVIKAYYQEITSRYSGNRTIIIWDLYNEAWEKDRDLQEHLFAWVREVNPRQPVTACWGAHDFSDIITFHTYQPPGGKKRDELQGLLSFEEEIDYALSYNRPVLCTEWLARTFGNNFQNVLPIFAANHIGFYFWGLVAGSAQYRFPWNWPEGAPEPYLWFHEILYPDGEPYKREEIDRIKEFSFVKKSSL
jgi:hypothetical protein